MLEGGSAITAQGDISDYEAIRQEIMARDTKDSTRADAPLICPEDAERIDTSHMTLGEVLDLLERRVRARVEGLPTCVEATGHGE